MAKIELKYIKMSSGMYLHLLVNERNWVPVNSTKYYKLAKQEELKKYNQSFKDYGGLIVLQYIKNHNIPYTLHPSDR